MVRIGLLETWFYSALGKPFPNNTSFTVTSRPRVFERVCTNSRVLCLVRGGRRPQGRDAARAQPGVLGRQTAR